MQLAQTDGGSRACRMFGRVLAEHPPFLRHWLTEHFRPVVQRFGQALSRTQPHVAPDEILWRLHFIVGAMSHTLLHAELLHAVTDGSCDDANREIMLDRLVTFCSAGLAAEASTCDQTNNSRHP